MVTALGQSNRAGMGGTFGIKRKQKGTSAQAAKNLANSSAATKSTKFSFNRSQQWNHVSGQNTNKPMHKYDFTDLRSQRNRYQAPSSRLENQSYDIGRGSYSMNFGNNAGMKAALAFGIINNSIGMLSAFADMGFGAYSSFNSASNSVGVAGNSTNLGTISNGGVSSSISSMASAGDSATLRTAIGSAEATLQNLDMQTGTLEAQANTAKDNVENLKTTVSQKKDAVGKAQNNLKTKQNSTKSCEEQRNNKQNALELADKKYGQATSAYNAAHDKTVDTGIKYNAAVEAKQQAQTGYINAKASYDAIPDTNPAKEPARKAMEEAKAKFDEAMKNEQTLKSQYDQAKEAEAKAKEAKENAYKELGDSKQAVDKAEADLNKAQTQLDQAKEKEQFAKEEADKANEEFEQAKTDLSSAEGSIEKFKAHTQDMKSLQKEIANQKERLSKLEKQEIDTYNKNKENAQSGIEKNNTRAGNINGEVDTVRERRLSNKIGKTNAKVDNYQSNMEAVSSNVDKTFVANTLSKQGGGIKGSDGCMYRTAINPTTGNTVYAKDGIMITEDEYKAATGQ